MFSRYIFKSIFSKMIAIFVSILIVAFSIAGVMLYYFLSDFVLTEKVNLLEENGDRLNSALNTFVKYNDNSLSKVLLNLMLEQISSNTQSIVWVANPDGVIVFSQAEPSLKRVKDYLDGIMEDDSGHLRFPDKRQYENIMQGKEQAIKNNGDFYGLFRDTGIPWLTIAKPFKYMDKNSEEKILATVYLSTPIPEVHKVRTSVIRYFMFSVLIAVGISIILVYIFSLRITKPLKQIKNAARIIAGGEFQKRLDINSRDEIGELATSFNQMAVALQNLEELRRGFIANVSHELRTPMTSIRGFIEGILDGVIPPEKQADYLMIVRDETNRLNRLVNDLLDLAKMESGEVTLNIRGFDINELIRRCIIKLETIIEKKGIQVEANFEREETFVSADPDAIERVIINLVHNAIKFTNEGGKISVFTSYQKGKVLVAIQDNGIGIDAEEIDLIWDRFYKADKSRGKDKTGTGLGLAIIKSLINEHKQSIWVESKVGEGSKFSFTLEKASAEN